jgi:hypothetical protein
MVNINYLLNAKSFTVFFFYFTERDNALADLYYDVSSLFFVTRGHLALGHNTHI